MEVRFCIMSREIDKLRLIVPECCEELGKKVDEQLVNMYDNKNSSFIVPIEEVWFSGCIYIYRRWKLFYNIFNAWLYKSCITK